ncbi:MAG: caspase family protein [Bacteroidales bacterium]|nr:caspase family protein [Bacteroidales bacterium]
MAIFSLCLVMTCGRSDKPLATKADVECPVPPGDEDSNSFPSEERSATVVAAKRALIIGLGEQEDSQWAKINGDKDVPFVQKMLKSVGYADIRTLVNRQATKAAMVSAFKKMSDDCFPGDTVYVHFSGHGQQVTDVNGDEEDGWDEAWIPYDACLTYGEKDKGEKHLIDDEINRLLTNIRDKIGDEGKLLVVVDACHSGGSSRGGRQDDLEEGVVVRGAGDDFVIPCATKTKTTHTPAPERWITLSACKDFQLNQEISKPQVGKLTYALYMTALRGKVTFQKIEDFMIQYSGRLPQTPVLTGDTINYKISDFLK